MNAEYEEKFRALIVEEARSWLGTPFIHQAKVKGVGVGCGTLNIAIFEKFDYAVPSKEDMGRFSKDWHFHEKSERYLEMLSRYMVEIPGPPKPGDVAIFKMGRVYGHSAIVVNWPNEVIHVMWKRNVEIADATKAPLAGRAAKFFSVIPASQEAQ